MKNSSQQKLERARKHVKDIRGFYSHVVIYIVINVMIALVHYKVDADYGNNQDFSNWSYLTTPFFWGIGLTFHGLRVFYFKLGFLKRWEERKIDQLMKEEREDFENFKRFE